MHGFICYNVFSSYPIQVFVIFNIVEENSFFHKRSDSSNRKQVKSIIVRSLIVIAITITALVIPNFLLFLNITGSVGAALLAFVLPPLYYVQTRGVKRRENEGKGLGYSEELFNYFLILFGLVGMVCSVTSTLKTFLNT